MALEAIVTDMESVPEELREHYSEMEGGGFRLNVTGSNGWELENTTALKSALGRERANASDANKRLKTFEGLDPEAARDALGKIEEFANFDPEQKVQEAIEQRQKQLVAKHEEQMKMVSAERDSLMSELEANLITSNATKALAAAKGSVDLLLPHVKQQTRMRRLENGSYIAEVVDAEGNPRIGDTHGNPMTIQQLIDEMRGSDTFARAFESTGATGTGATGTSSTSTTKVAGGVVRKISRGDQEAINSSLDDLATGKAILVD